MQVYCAQSEQLKHCLLVSTTVGVQLPVVFKEDDGEVYSLGSCDVNDVRIIHDCKSRQLSEVVAELRQHNINGKYYLHVSEI